MRLPITPVLDATAGGRMMWFDKRNRLATFIDIRDLDAMKLSNGSTHEVKPDHVMDFRALDFPSNSFYLVVFDPPHLKHTAGDNSYMVRKYGKLDKDWSEQIRSGFEECWRVTRPNGVIVLKWNETHIKTSELIASLGRTPLFGHTTNSRGTTKWMCFLKVDEKEQSCAA